MTCDTTREWIRTELDGELAVAERADLQDHLRGCAACAAALDEERTLRLLLDEARTPEVPEELLRNARARLSEAIGREPLPVGRRTTWWGRLAGAGHSAGFRLSPIAAAVLLVVGIAIGGVIPRLASGGWIRPGPAAPESGGANAGDPSGAVDTVAVRDLVAGPEAGTVRVAYDTLRRGALTGPPADPRIRRLLVDTLRDNPNDGLRLEAIEALGGQVNEAEARAALLRTIVEDHNAGARLSAIEALAARAGDDGAVRRAMLEAVQRDTNPGVRVRAIDALAAAPHPDVIPALRRLAREDRNDYVRIRAAALIGEAAGGDR